MTADLLFGGICTEFLATLHFYPRAFKIAAGRLNVLVGDINTLIPRASSVTMTMAVHHAREGIARPSSG